MKVVRGGICAPEGVRAYGIKEGNKGLAVIEGEGRAVGMFTSNKIQAAPVRFTKKQLKKGSIRAIIANSGCANSFTGERGMGDAERMAELASSALGLARDEVAVASTGPIGVHLDMGLIERQLRDVVKKLTAEEPGSAAAARAIMTTDTFPKEQAIQIDTSTGERAVIGGIAKGSGMIFPHLGLATMLSFLYTDASVEDEVLRRSLNEAVDNSFNMVVVDGDMSTNDMVLLVSTGKSVPVSEADFKAGLQFVCRELAKLIARDGEGATKFIEVRVSGASSMEDAREVGRSILRSPLVKSAIQGERPDFMCGRIIAAIGSSAIAGDVDPQGLSIRIKCDKEVIAVKNGAFMDLSGVAREILRGKEIVLEVDLGTGEGEATAWGCDLSAEYVRINAGMH
ncbi:MAG: bifunctional ornithine acetyltransferase/N-acetylglutamate synthase [Methanophagales archaeon ANME-1-THS]|nr:MAG: bifunctional ornithine acetyltransferase/N-acetylglutamate synthase [Methanophagales archaeon ANME-1-THS]